MIPSSDTMALRVACCMAEGSKENLISDRSRAPGTEETFLSGAMQETAPQIRRMNPVRILQHFIL
jgi:hypothetical protein